MTVIHRVKPQVSGVGHLSAVVPQRFTLSTAPWPTVAHTPGPALTCINAGWPTLTPKNRGPRQYFRRSEGVARGPLLRNGPRVGHAPRRSHDDGATSAPTNPQHRHEEQGMTTTWDPRKGEKLGKSWRAVHAMLTQADGPTNWITVKEAARRAGDIKSASARAFMADLRRHGLVEKTTRGVTITAKGRALS